MFGSLTTQRMVVMVASALFAGLLSIFVFWKPASGAVPVSGFEDKQFSPAPTDLTSLRNAMAMEFAPDGRLFVAERQGKIRVIEPQGDGTGTLRQKSFVTIPKDELDTRRQRGIQGIAIPPDFPTDPTDPNNRFVYVHYTQEDPNGGPSHNRIVRFTEEPAIAGATEPTNKALEAGDSGIPIFELDDLGTSFIHNGGHIEFGNDFELNGQGDKIYRLYIPVGDNKRNKEAPIIDNLFSLKYFFGKVVRINDDGSIPTDNPFYDKANGQYRAIYARGFREPFSLGVEPPPGNRIYINDVGEQSWEEINELRAGKNYGWDVCEGEVILESGGQDCPSRYTDPIFTYAQNVDGTCAITAGTFYPESGPFPAEYRGDYFFADLCSGWIRRYAPTTDTVIEPDFATGTSQPIDLKVSPVDGGLYYLEDSSPTANGSPTVRVIRYTGP